MQELAGVVSGNGAELFLTIRYRPEIDGLRTVAVLSVIIYHAEFELAGHSVLSGGFFGVDIFFVISGFLITSLIMSELNNTDQLSILNFYERRARRLLPALLLVMLASIAAAWHILLPSQLIDFSNSLIASLLFVSNFYWDMSLQEYGAESSLLKPFLHTWSLAVEEQYYLIFPLIMLGIHRWQRKRLAIFLCAGMLISLVFAVWFTTVNFHSSFYMLPSRFWELLAGGVLATMMYRHPASEYAALKNHVLPAVGLLLLLLSFVFVRYDAYLNHPGLVTIVPVLGTVLIMGFAHKEDLVTRILASRLFVAIGLISYSLYLWHFPIFAFARNVSASLSISEKLLWIGVTFLLSILSYFLVEKPFRNRAIMPTTRMLGTLSLLSLLVVVFWGYTIHTDGDKSRFPHLVSLYGINEFDNVKLKEESWSVLNGRASERNYGDSSPHEASRFEAEALWFGANRGQRKVLIVGNSTSRDIFNAFYLNAEKFPGYEFSRFGMHPSMKTEQIATLQASPNFKEADTVIVAFQLGEDHLQKFAPFVELLKGSGKRLYLLSNRPVFMKREGKALFDYYMQTQQAPELDKSSVDKVFFQHMLRNYSGNVDPPLRLLAERLDIPFWNIPDLVCDLDKKNCVGITPDGYKVYFDPFHWTLEGAEYFGGRISELGWLESE